MRGESGDPTRLVLDIDPGSDPIEGAISGPGRPGRRFCGYLQLMAAVEDARADGARADGADEGPDAPASRAGPTASSERREGQ